ncbi:hypothetical protein [Arthrobacter sp. AQ5-05]|uniref:hypothetical protein n=1 Tax=Arthrobacter sp. AQ5-05 TaxID=2184581 RepID=UPI0011BE6150|nr:hypothetical protein [Arthrobacter sp. AQ5-05]
MRSPGGFYRAGITMPGGLFWLLRQGTFLAAGSIAVRHFEILMDELRNAAEDNISGGGTGQ